jgi:hypothetical protein
MGCEIRNQWVQEMRKVTLVLMVWSMESGMVGDGRYAADSGDVLRKGISKLALHRPPLDALLLPDALLDDALLPDQATASGVTPVVGTVVVTGDGSQMIGKILGSEKEIERASEDQGSSVVLRVLL